MFLFYPSKKSGYNIEYRIHFPPFYVFSGKFGDIEELWCLNSSFLLWKWIRCTFFDVIASYLFYLLFQLEISSLINPMVKVFGLRSGGMLLEKATISWIMEGAEKLYAGSQQQIVLYLKVSISFCSVALIFATFHFVCTRESSLSRKNHLQFAFLRFKSSLFKSSKSSAWQQCVWRVGTYTLGQESIFGHEIQISIGKKYWQKCER